MEWGNEVARPDGGDLSVVESFQAKFDAVSDPNMITAEWFDSVLDLFWHGEPSDAVHALIEEARAAGLPVVVHRRPWTRAELVAARARISADTSLRAELNVTLIGFTQHANGIRVGLARPDAAECHDAKALLQAVAGGIPVDVVAARPEAFQDTTKPAGRA
jgi:hypothetical protein